MKLPNHNLAYVAPSKLMDYLLSESHPSGQSKAKFFRLIGFDTSSLDQLREGLLQIVHEQEITQIITSPHGIKYVIEGPLETPRGRIVHLKTIWIIDAGHETPRFVTAYPR